MPTDADRILFHPHNTPSQFGQFERVERTAYGISKLTAKVVQTIDRAVSPTLVSWPRFTPPTH